MHKRLIVSLVKRQQVVSVSQEGEKENGFLNAQTL